MTKIEPKIPDQPDNRLLSWKMHCQSSCKILPYLSRNSCNFMQFYAISFTSLLNLHISDNKPRMSAKLVLKKISFPYKH